MMQTHRNTKLLAVGILASMLLARADAQPRKKPATQADIDRLEKKIEAQGKLIENLIRVQMQYAAALGQVLAGGAPVAPPVSEGSNAPITPKPEPKPEPKPDARVDKPKKEAKPVAKAKATLSGKVRGASDAYIYIDDLVASVNGSATMKQQGKQFVPRVLVVQKGTRVEFPNMDTIFHNVFSVTPDNSFDLGSYRQGESKSVTMVKPGVVNVYCNMHPQMVGSILVVPGGYFTHAGADGAYTLANVPAGHHRVVAWAPNARPISKEVDLGDAESITVDFELKQSRAQPHTNKDGMPYGSYKE
jgi:plastocyanin